MSLIIFLANLFSPNFKAEAKQSNKIQLISIGFSHYCDLASWCLKVAGLPFQEYNYAAGEHVLPTLSVRVGDKSQVHLSASSKVTPVASPHLSKAEKEARAVRAAKKDRETRSTAVPVAVTPEGRVWKDSWEIASMSGLPNIDPTLKNFLDEKVGILTRQLAYHFILHPRNENIWNKLLTHKRSFFWKVLWWLFAGKQLKKIMYKLMKPLDDAAVEECKTQLAIAIAQLDAMILAKKTPYLSGDKIGIADIAVASLVGPIVHPPKYCGGRYAPIMEELIAQDRELREVMNLYRATPTGVFVMKLYDEHR